MPEITIIDDKRTQILSTSVQEEQTVVIPAQVILPDIRNAFPSGFLAQGDVITIPIVVTDKDGNPKPLPDIDNFQVTINDWPSDPTQEILAVFYMNFVQSTIPQTTPSPNVQE